MFLWCELRSNDLAHGLVKRQAQDLDEEVDPSSVTSLNALAALPLEHWRDWPRDWRPLRRVDPSSVAWTQFFSQRCRWSTAVTGLAIGGHCGGWMVEPAWLRCGQRQ